ncbi:MAG TPA: winged helix-turn-helix domain-containing protein [Micromonosporaceae bacterium]
MPRAEAPFRRIANDFTEKIKSGELPPGAKLPSIREISEAYGVSTGTVDRALSLLHDRNLVVGHPGRGVYVREPDQSE